MSGRSSCPTASLTDSVVVFCTAVVFVVNAVKEMGEPIKYLRIFDWRKLSYSRESNPFCFSLFIFFFFLSANVDLML